MIIICTIYRNCTFDTKWASINSFFCHEFQTVWDIVSHACVSEPKEIEIIHRFFLVIAIRDVDSFLKPGGLAVVWGA